jgi:hypothetical protein
VNHLHDAHRHGIRRNCSSLRSGFTPFDPESLEKDDNVAGSRHKLARQVGGPYGVASRPARPLNYRLSLLDISVVETFSREQSPPACKTVR